MKSSDFPNFCLIFSSKSLILSPSSYWTVIRWWAASVDQDVSRLLRLTLTLRMWTLSLTASFLKNGMKKHIMCAQIICQQVRTNLNKNLFRWKPFYKNLFFLSENQMTNLSFWSHPYIRVIWTPPKDSCHSVNCPFTNHECDYRILRHRNQTNKIRYVNE